MESFVLTLQSLNKSVSSSTPYESEPPDKQTSSQSRSLQRETSKPLAETLLQASTASECNTFVMNFPFASRCSNRSMQNDVVSEVETATKPSGHLRLSASTPGETKMESVSATE